MWQRPKFRVHDIQTQPPEEFGRLEDHMRCVLARGHRQRHPSSRDSAANPTRTGDDRFRHVTGPVCQLARGVGAGVRARHLGNIAGGHVRLRPGECGGHASPGHTRWLGRPDGGVPSRDRGPSPETVDACAAREVAIGFGDFGHAATQPRGVGRRGGVRLWHETPFAIPCHQRCHTG